MKALSLFTGIGGIDLAAEWAGIKTVAMCEREPFCQKVLNKHWPSVPIYDDVKTLTKERLEADGVGTIDVIFSGDPCQPYSYAGKREGKDDDRFLWPQVNRLLDTVHPKWVVRENVSGNITLGIDGVLTDLEDRSYTATTLVLPALAVGAQHERERVFVVAYSYGESRSQKDKVSSTIRKIGKAWEDAGWSGWGQIPGLERVVSRPRVSGTIDGIPYRMDRSRALGNAVVPQQIYPILAAIKQIDDALREDPPCNAS